MRGVVSITAANAAEAGHNREAKSEVRGSELIVRVTPRVTPRLTPARVTLGVRLEIRLHLGFVGADCGRVKAPEHRDRGTQRAAFAPLPVLRKDLENRNPAGRCQPRPNGLQKLSDSFAGSGPNCGNARLRHSWRGALPMSFRRRCTRCVLL